MRLVCILCILLPWATLCPAETPDTSQSSAANLAAEFEKIAVNPEQTYRVRDLQFSRGDIKIYLNEGVLSFATPLAGHICAAVFIAQAAEAGDAEILLLPPQRSERASLALYTKTPNLDEHFNSAVFLFSDDTAAELLSKIEQGAVRKAPEVATQNEQAANTVLRGASSEIRIRLIQALLDNHKPEDGSFYAFIGGRDLGGFDLAYQPADPEPISAGRPWNEGGRATFQLWTAFRPRRATPFVERSGVLSDYRIDTTIHPDLSMASVADFTYAAAPGDGRALGFALSARLRVDAATIDGQPVEIFQPKSPQLEDREDGRNFLLVSAGALEPGSRHRVQIRYEGSVIRQTGSGGYFVDERNVWYPYVAPMLTTFDLTFRFTPRLTLVSTGELVSDETVNGVRVVHRRTGVPEGLAGFNLGAYKSSVEEHGPYQVESYAEEKSAQSLEAVAQKTESVLDYYTKQWTALPIHALAVTPIAGTFGQGFPGLIYLSTVAYLRLEDRPRQLRNARMDTFFSEMLLPHEVAHQWWGNIVIPADYRTGWLPEAMANYSALQVLEQSQSVAAVDEVLDSYRTDLAQQQNGKPIESFGPVDFGIRLLDAAGIGVWHSIVYEKGTWVLRMLRERLGAAGFRQMQLRLLEEFRAKPISNEDFRRVASAFVPAGQPDKDLTLFFDTWVYGTGIPQISLAHTSEGQALVVSGVDDDFSADLPVRCHDKAGVDQLRWVRVSSGSNPLENGGRSGA